MKKYIISLLVFAMPFIYFCCNSSSDMDFSTEKSQAVEAAKSFIINNGNVLSLPIQPSNVATRSVSYPTDATPIWEQARIEMYKDEQVVIVPLEGQEEIRSRAVITMNNEENYQFAKTFSRLIVHHKKNGTIAYVVTYLPESSYAEGHTQELADLGFGIRRIKYEGLILISSLNGVLEHTLISNNGHVTYSLEPMGAHKHGEVCVHEYSDAPTVSMYLYSTANEIMTRDSYGDGDENRYCARCGNHLNYCTCICWQCGNDPCTCEIFFCEVCGKLPCECFMDPHACKICMKTPCICKED